MLLKNILWNFLFLKLYDLENQNCSFLSADRFRNYFQHFGSLLFYSFYLWINIGSSLRICFKLSHISRILNSSVPRYFSAIDSAQLIVFSFQSNRKWSCRASSMFIWAFNSAKRCIQNYSQLINFLGALFEIMLSTWNSFDCYRDSWIALEYLDYVRYDNI